MSRPKRKLKTNAKYVLEIILGILVIICCLAYQKRNIPREKREETTAVRMVSVLQSELNM